MPETTSRISAKSTFEQGHGNAKKFHIYKNSVKHRASLTICTEIDRRPD